MMTTTVVEPQKMVGLMGGQRTVSLESGVRSEASHLANIMEMAWSPAGSYRRTKTSSACFSV